MGQRLNLEIRKKNKPLANSYYHWSAYTSSAYHIASIAIGYIQSNSDEKDSKLLAIKALEATGAGMKEDEIEFFKSLSEYKDEEFQKCVSRDEGILCACVDTIKETQDWAEGTVILHIDDPDDIHIDFDVFSFYESKEDYELQCSLDDDEIKTFETSLVNVSYDTTYLSCKELDALMDLVISKGDNIELSDGTIIMEFS